jgi:hypothetical protein
VALLAMDNCNAGSHKMYLFFHFLSCRWSEPVEGWLRWSM